MKWKLAALLATGLLMAIMGALPLQGAPLVEDGGTTYMVQYGDTIYSIAGRFGVTVEALLAANGLTNPNYIYVGQSLLIPSSLSPVEEGSDGYVVQYGDTLYSIARRFGLTVETLMAANGLYNHNLLYIGQRLNIPTFGPSAPATASSGLEYGIAAPLFEDGQAGEKARRLKEMGFTWVRVEIPWSEVEREREVYDWNRVDALVEALEGESLQMMAQVVSSPSWARADGLQEFPPDDYGELGRFLGALASRYRGRIKAYQIWDQANLTSRFADAAEYVALLRVAYLYIKAVDPQAEVITASLTTTEAGVEPADLFLKAMYLYGGGHYFDRLAVKAWGEPSWPQGEALRGLMEGSDQEGGATLLEVAWPPSQMAAEAGPMSAYRWMEEQYSPWVGLIIVTNR